MFAELNKLSVTLSCKYLGNRHESDQLPRKCMIHRGFKVRTAFVVFASLTTPRCISTQLAVAISIFTMSFEEDGLQLKFLQPNIMELEYAQGKADWTPYLSVVDVVMWNDKTTLARFLDAYDLVDGHANQAARDQSAKV